MIALVITLKDKLVPTATQSGVTQMNPEACDPILTHIFEARLQPYRYVTSAYTSKLLKRPFLLQQSWLAWRLRRRG